MRLSMALVPGLAVALVVVAGMADRALVGQADATRAAAVAPKPPTEESAAASAEPDRTGPAG